MTHKYCANLYHMICVTQSDASFEIIMVLHVALPMFIHYHAVRYLLSHLLTNTEGYKWHAKIQYSYLSGPKETLKIWE